MRIPMLVVDKSITVSKREQNEWLKYEISTVRVNSMQEAIEKLTKESFLFTAINADNINYLPLLKVMRDSAPTLIAIIDSTYTTEKEIEAVHNGADVYTKFNKDVKMNVKLAMARLLRCNERDKRPVMQPGMVIYEKFLVLSNECRIFYNDERLKLTKKEYDILHYFIVNHDCRLTYNQIYFKIWGYEFDGSRHNALWDYILKIRKKIKNVAGDIEYIKNERDIGYTFSAKYDI